MKHAIELKINGDNLDVLVAPNETLLDVLRQKLGLMGTKKGCDLGACGACTVIMNGEACLSCLVLAVDASGSEILTIEGIGGPDGMHPLQESFLTLGGLQCGFCTPGMILTAKSILDEDPNPSRETINRKMAGNLCRCTGYKKVVESVEDAARKMRGGE